MITNEKLNLMIEFLEYFLEENKENISSSSKMWIKMCLQFLYDIRKQNSLAWRLWWRISTKQSSN